MQKLHKIHNNYTNFHDFSIEYKAIQCYNVVRSYLYG